MLITCQFDSSLSQSCVSTYVRTQKKALLGTKGIKELIPSSQFQVKLRMYPYFAHYTNYMSLDF